MKRTNERLVLLDFIHLAFIGRVKLWVITFVKRRRVVLRLATVHSFVVSDHAVDVLERCTA